MKILTKIRRYFQKSDLYGYMRMTGRWSSVNFKTMVSEAYKKNAYGYAVVERPARKVGRLPWRQLASGPKGMPIQLPPDDPLVKLWKRPSRTWKLSQATFLEAVMQHLALSGKSVIQKVRAGNEVKELVILRPDKVKPKGDDSDPFGTWEYEPDGGTKIKIPGEDIIYIRYPDPLDLREGQSPMEACYHAVEQINQGDKWNYGLIKNGGQLQMQFVLDKSMDKHDAEEARRRIQADVADPNVVAYVGNVRGEVLGNTPADISWQEGKTVAAREIYITHMVPSTFGPDIQSQNYAQLSAAVKQMVLDAILPPAQMIAEEFSRQMCDQDFPGKWLAIDMNEIEELIEEIASEWAAITAAWDLTVNEKRELRGKDSIGGDLGQSILVPANLVPPPENGTGNE